MYKIKKDLFEITIQKLDKNFKIKISRNLDKRYFSLVSGRVFIYEKDWVLLDTSTLTHKKQPENKIEKGIFDVFKVILLYPVNNEYLKLEYDERMFLEQITYKLYLEEDIKEYLPVEEYTLKENKVVYQFNDEENYHLLPSSENLSEDEFISQY